MMSTYSTDAVPSILNQRRKIPVLLWLILGVFFIKTLCLAFWVIPLWDVQDEPGHYSYILDLANGKGLPVMGETYFDEKVKDNWLEDSWKEQYTLNWIAQHPPLYYALNSLILSTARFFISDDDFLFRVTRILSILSGTLALFVLYFLFYQVTSDDRFALFTTASISFIPMFGYQSSGTTHDALLALLSATAILNWVKFIMTRDMKNAICMAFFLSLSAITKSTALLLYVPLVGICFFYIEEGSVKRRMWKFALICSVAMILPGLWMVRSYVNYGIILSTWHGVMESITEADLLRITMHDYLTYTHIIENLYTTFFGEFGWTSRGGRCMVLLVKNSMNFMSLYYILGSLFLLLSLLFYVKNEIVFFGSKICIYTIFFFLLVTYFLYFTIPVKSNMYMLSIFYAFFLSIFVFSFYAINIMVNEYRMNISGHLKGEVAQVRLPDTVKIVYLSLFVCLFYSVVFVLQLKGMYERYHMLRADHGRYWIPIVSLFGFAFVLPSFRIFNPYKVILFLISLLLAVNEFCIYYYYVIPFFNS